MYKLFIFSLLKYFLVENGGVRLYPGTQEAEAGAGSFCELEANLVYIEVPGQLHSENLSQKNKNPNKSFKTQNK